MSILNQMRKNPAMTAGAFIFIIALIAVIGWIVNRRKKEKEGDGKPQITITGIKMKLNPDKSKIEEYRMYEYNTGDGSGTSAAPRGSQLATNIDLTLSWTNGTGFNTNKVSKLIFKRFIRPMDPTDTSGDILVEDSTKHQDSTTVTDFASAMVTIDGDNLATAYTTGTDITTDQGYQNVIKIYYTKIGDTTEYLLMETNRIDISKNDLMRTLDISKVESVVINVSPGTAALVMGTNNPNMFYKIYSVPGAETPALKLSEVSTSTGRIKFTNNNTSYKFGIDFGDDDPYFMFEKISEDNDDMFLKVVDGDEADKYVVGTGTGFKLMEFDDIKRTAANFINSRVRIVGNENAGSISEPDNMPTSSSTTPAAGPYVYRFEVKDVTTFDASRETGDYRLGPHINEIKVDGTKISAYQIAFGSSDSRRAVGSNDFHAYDEDMDTGISWTKESVGDTLMTITLPTRPNIISVAWGRQIYRPNFKIYENDELIITESGTRGEDIKDLYTEYDIKNKRVYTPSPGFNRNGDSIVGPLDKTVDECKVACGARNDCIGFTWKTDGTGCFLKGSGVGGYVPTTDYTFYEKSHDIPIMDNYHSDIYTGVTPAVNAEDQYKELGAGNSVEACRTLATAEGWKAYGFRKNEQTCWAIKDVGIVSNGLINDTNYTIGCTDAGKTIDGNCGYDVQKGQHVVRSVYDVSDASGNDYRGVSMDDCRKIAETKNWKTFGHRSKDHPNNPNTCWGITGTWTSGDIEANDNHSIGCTETGKTLDNQCN